MTGTVLFDAIFESILMFIGMPEIATLIKGVAFH